MPYIAIAIIVLSILVGVMGRDSKIGFLGTFFLSMVFTPLIVYLVLVFIKPQPFQPPGKTN